MNDTFSPKILIFSWNHQALRICETADLKTKKKNRQGYFGMGLTTSYQFDCLLPDFFPEWQKIIEEKDPDVVVFGSQEDASPGSYMHSDFLPDVMESELGYIFFKRTKLMGIGVETY